MQIEPLQFAGAIASSVGKIKDLPCIECPVRKSNFCGGLLGEQLETTPLVDLKLKQVFRITPKRRNIYQAGTKSDDAIMICSGWAFRFVQLPDGRRQILSILLPGDLISPIGIFAERLKFSVQALTEVHHCAFNRVELQAKLPASSGTFITYIKDCAANAEQLHLLLADLGRRNAAERVSRFILRLMDRMTERGIGEADSFPFPLRQQHLADAVGLTTVHVSRVMAKLRSGGILDVAKDRLRVGNLAELKRVADIK